MTKEERLKAAEAYAASIEKYSYLDEYAFTNRQVNQIAQDNAHLGFIAGAEAEAESKWISVDDRLPDIDIYFIAWDNKEQHIILEKRTLSTLVPNDWTYQQSYKKHITHWQLLPTPPLNQQ